MCTPAGYGAAEARWDTWRICEFAEILGFYGLQYWYTWQVSVLGLGPIWMSGNEPVKQRTARLLGGRRHLRLRPLGEDARRRHLLDRHDRHACATRGATRRAAASTTSATATRRRSSRPSARSPGRTTTSSSPPIRSTRRYECVQNVCASQNYRLRVRAARLSAHRSGHPAQGARRLGCRAEHGQHRQVQPRLGLDRYLHARLLRGDRHTPPTAACTTCTSPTFRT